MTALANLSEAELVERLHAVMPSNGRHEWRSVDARAERERLVAELDARGVDWEKRLSALKAELKKARQNEGQAA